MKISEKNSQNKSKNNVENENKSEVENKDYYNNTYHLIIENQTVEVTKEIYYAYKRPLWKEHKRKSRSWRCLDGRGVRCSKDCNKCNYYRQGNKPIGTTLSLDLLREENEYEAKCDENVEEIVAYKILLEALNNSLDMLSDEKRQIANFIKLGKSEREMAKNLGISRTTLSYRKKKLLDELREGLIDLV